MAGLGGLGGPPQAMQPQGGSVPPMDDMGAMAPEMEDMPPEMAAPGDGGMMDASPEEQAMYNRFVAMCVLGLSNEANLKLTIDTIHNSEAPTDGVAVVAGAMIVRVAGMAQEEGNEIPGDVLMHGGQEVVEYTVELAEAAGLAEFSPAMMEQAFYKTVDNVTETLGGAGQLDQEAMGADMAEIEQMQGSGELDSFLSQLSAEQQPPMPEETAPMPDAPLPEEGM